MNKFPFFIRKFLFVIALVVSELMYSQINPSGPDTPPPPVGLPIDGGVFMLLVLGIAFGVTSLRSGKK